jgi:hypothetical protein
METKIQKTKFICSQLPDPEEWKNLLFKLNSKNEDKITMTLVGKESKTVTIKRLITAERIPLRKDIKYVYGVLLGSIKSPKISKDFNVDTTVYFGTPYCAMEVNHTKKTVKMKIHRHSKTEFPLP